MPAKGAQPKDVILHMLSEPYIFDAQTFTETFSHHSRLCSQAATTLIAYCAPATMPENLCVSAHASSLPPSIMTTCLELPAAASSGVMPCIVSTARASVKISNKHAKVACTHIPLGSYMAHTCDARDRAGTTSQGRKGLTVTVNTYALLPLLPHDFWQLDQHHDPTKA